MTGQRWFLTTPKHYTQAPVGTELWPTSQIGGRLANWWWVKRLEGWFASNFPDDNCYDLEDRCEVKRWGTDQDHERARRDLDLVNKQLNCRSMLISLGWSQWLRSHT